MGVGQRPLRVREANAWLALEVAWRELPAPRTNEIVVGGADYGAVRGFMAPQGHRWSRGRAWLRLSPRERAAHYDLAIEMGSPEPSPWPAPEVRLRVNGAAWIPLVLARRVGAFHVPGTPDDQGALVVELRAPTWSRPGFPPDLGVWVERLSVRPASR